MKNIKQRFAMIAVIAVAVIALFGTSFPVEAAAKTPKKITLQTTAKTIDIKGKAVVSVKSVSPSAASKSVTFKSSNKKVATVSSKGVVRGKKAGTVTITVTSKSNKKVKKTIKIKVKNMKPASISLAPEKLTLKSGQEETLKVSVKPEGVYCPVSYGSSNTSVVSVDANGKVVAKKDGTATITVKTKEKNSKGKYLSQKCQITVSSKVEEIKFAETELKLGVKDAVGSVDITVSPKSATNKDLEYSSSDENIAKVDAEGKVTATGYGTATIMAKTKDGSNKQASYKVIVTKPEAVSSRQVFVTPEWLKSVIDGDQEGYENAVIADASWLTDYCTKEHIPTAIHINSDEVEYVDWTPWGSDNVVGNNVDDLWDYNRKGNNYGKITFGDGEGEVPVEQIYNYRPDDQLQLFFKRYGITKDTKVILYGKKGNSSDTGRTAFAFLNSGVKDVKILDGGMQGWNALGLPTTTEVIEPTPGGDDYSFGGEIEHKYVLSIEEVVDKLNNDSNFKLVSIRSRDEFEGVKSNYAYIENAGEPLGAVWGKNIGDYVKQDGYVISIDTMKQYLAESNINYDDSNEELSFYCGTGWRATIPFFLAYQDGRENISLYDGGWYQWELRWKENPTQYPRQKITPEQAAYYSKMQFTKKSISIEVNETAVNPVILKPASASATVKYEVEDPSIAEVDEKGNITGKSTGSTTIFATALDENGQQIGKRVTAGIIVNEEKTE